MCEARIDDLFGCPNRMPLDVEDLFVNGVAGTRKWLVQPGSTMARVLGTKVKGAVVFATFSLYFVPRVILSWVYLYLSPLLCQIVLLPCHTRI